MDTVERSVLADPSPDAGLGKPHDEKTASDATDVEQGNGYKSKNAMSQVSHNR